MLKDELERVLDDLRYVASDIPSMRREVDDKQDFVQVENAVDEAVDALYEAIGICERKGL